MRSYPSYGSSGIQWVGDYPSHWTTTRTDRLLFHNRTKNKGLIESNVLSLSYGRIIRRDVDSNTGLLPDSFESYQVLEPGDIVLRLTDLQNDQRSLRVGLVKERGIITSVYVGLRRSRDDVDPTYFYYLFHSYDLMKVFYGMGGGIRQSMRFEDVRRIPVLHPPLDEQRWIVGFLDETTSLIDQIVEKKTKRIELLVKLRSSLVSEVVTKGLDRNVEMRDSGTKWIGDIPSHWRVTPLKFLGEFKNGISKGSEYFGSGYPFVNYGDVYNNETIPTEVEGLVESSDDDREKYSVKRGDVFFTRTSESMDDIGVSSTCLVDLPNGVFSGFVIRFRFYGDEHLPEYSRYHFQSSWKDPLIHSRMNIVTRSSLSQDVLGRVPVLVPPLREQEEICSYLNERTEVIDDQVSREEESILLLRELRRSLISEVVTGKIDVRKETVQ